MARGWLKNLAFAFALACPGIAAAQAQPVVPVEEPATVAPPVVQSEPDAPQQSVPAPLPSVTAAVRSEVRALRSGPLLIHGNYCGIGNRPGSEPIDSLDIACMHHDACTHTGSLPSCACDDRLRAEATAVARDPATPPDVQAVAIATAASMTVLLCK